MNMANTSTETPKDEQGNSLHLNDTEFDDEYVPYFIGYFYIISIVTAFSCLAGLMGNVKVIWLLSFCIKRNPFTTYILNLAVADLGTLLSDFVFMMAITFLTIESYIFFELAEVFMFFTYNTSWYLLTALSLEKCLSVLLPVWYRCHRPERSSAMVSFLLWILSSLLCGILLLCHFQGSHCTEILNTICTVNFLICTPVMIVSSLTAWITIRRHSQGHQPPRLHVAILMTLLVSIIFDIPLSISFLFFTSEDFSMEELDASYLFANINSSVNPLIYYLVGRDRKRQPRESLKVVLQRLFKDEGDPREGN